MKELQHGGRAIFVADRIADAFELLGSALVESGMAADVKLWPSDRGGSMDFTLGKDRVDGRTRTLRAKPASGEGSHLDFDDIKG